MIPNVVLTSHTDGQSVPVGQVDVVFEVPGDGFAELTVNAMQPVVDYVMQPDDCTNGFICQVGERIFPTYTVTLDIASGPNLITVDAFSVN